MQLELIAPVASTATRPTPLLFVHGAWHGAWCWQEHFMPFFARAGFAAYAVSLRGHGTSEGHPRLRRHRISDYVQDVAHVIRQLPRPPVLIGHSMGGAIVQKYLETNKLPGGVLLASLPPTGVLSTVLRILPKHFWAFLKANLTLSLYHLIATKALAREFFFSPGIAPEKLERYHAQLQDESYMAFLDMLALNLPRPRRVTTPLLVLGATNDTIFHPEQVAATARAYHTTAIMFDNMAHDMMLEEGWEEVAAAILRWLDARGF